MAVEFARDCIATSSHDSLQQYIQEAEIIISHSVINDKLQQSTVFKNCLAILDYLVTLFFQGCDTEDAWKRMLFQADERLWRDKMAEVLRRRQLMDDQLAAQFDYVNFVQEFLTDNVLPVVVQPMRVTVGTVSTWNDDRQRLYLAELFIHSKNADLLDRIRPLDVWRVMVKFCCFCYGFWNKFQIFCFSILFYIFLRSWTGRSCPVCATGSRISAHEAEVRMKMFHTCGLLRIP